jgi:2-polyprenyl-3-methyl-5-hydroxy-6-metoxy-1,4-benzoquinol methylase
MNAVITHTRYLLRKVMYSDTVIGRVARYTRRHAGRPAFDRQYWDASLAGAMAPYLGGTLSVDTRNAIMCALLKHQAPDAQTLLDIGCAGGSLAGALSLQFVRYVGIDISEYAIQQSSRSFPQPGREFHASDLQAYKPVEQFDVIVFNEVLYYLPFEKILSELQRYANHLTSKGVIGVSLKDDPRNEAIARGISRDWVYLSGMLYQEKTSPQHRLTRDAKRPGYLTTVWRHR